MRREIKPVAELEREQVEPGVIRIKPAADPRGYKHGDVYLYKLDEMDEGAINKYGLTAVYERYKAEKNNAQT